MRVLHTSIHKIASHHITVHCSTRQYTILYDRTLHYTTLHNIVRHYTSLPCTTLHYTTLYTSHYIAVRCFHTCACRHRCERCAHAYIPVHGCVCSLYILQALGTPRTATSVSTGSSCWNASSKRLPKRATGVVIFQVALAKGRVRQGTALVSQSVTVPGLGKGLVMGGAPHSV